ncbi:hypothetical protein LZG04_28030 [Saccharothrix sp. S26]|uniref:hypothetical protein n=1 Tax=Saccharothrix sp. S26 TaxID=2907215 RepID=UPI001F287D2D|nr:hypothetical protein [Saccharothrix sp. S26]
MRSRTPPASTVTTVPGSTCRMPAQIAWPGVKVYASDSRTPPASTTRLASGLARIAFGSEPNRIPSDVR